ncbi:hypothetical protein [Burkholderia cenocepacia]|uniref:hypothetical protein n=1 Tax=Burkholderia cenocepacia TaxID=95486 RepID=UPI00223856FA|nr:hypothetical protein [Burkholderia cenocepacia]MCW5141064.1 hypothetical protein [Burkholderia cenocepacia]
MNFYPKWLYHDEHGAALVRDEAQEAALGDGWTGKPPAGLRADRVVDRRRLVPAPAPKNDDEPLANSGADPQLGPVGGDPGTGDGAGDTSGGAPAAGDEKAALLAEAAEKGVTVDKRWSAARIRDAIDSAAGA